MNHNKEISIFTKDKPSGNVPPEDHTLHDRYNNYKAAIQDLTIMDDIFMRNVLKKQECTEYILQVIMEKKDLKVQEQVIQQDYKNLQGRSAILDCVAIDEDGTKYDVEFQQASEGASPKRARYHSGLMDMNTLKARQDFDMLPESYMIFITRKDILGHHLPIYHIRRKIDEIGEDFKDSAYIIYVNSSIEEDTELGHLVHDLHCKNADEMYSPVLAQRVRELKETQKGVDHMSEVLDNLFEKMYSERLKLAEQRGISLGTEQGFELGMEQGMEQGALNTKKETALSLASIGLSTQQIAQVLKENIATIQEWISENSPVS